MSDSAKTDEIDDVVSSVRRLVSHGEKVPLRTRSQVDSERGAERFVLTPSLRVAEPALQLIDEALTKEPYNVLLLDPSNRADRAGLEATIAELEAAVTSQPNDWEPDEGEAFDDAAWAASAFQLHAVADAAGFDNKAKDDPAAPEHAPNDAGLKPVPDSPALSTDINIEALRAIVVEVLREELNGEMGERITRNVRKLVRREINRVLVSRELD